MPVTQARCHESVNVLQLVCMSVL